MGGSGMRLICCDFRLVAHPIFIGSGTDAAKNQPEARPLKGACDEGGSHRKWLDLVHGRDRRASLHPERHEDQDREQGQRLSGVVAGSEWTPAGCALDERRSRPLPQSCAALLSRGNLTARAIWLDAISHRVALPGDRSGSRLQRPPQLSRPTSLGLPISFVITNG